MRKLNKQNKTYITALSIFTALCLIGIIVFIVYKIKDYNTRYDINPISYVYSKGELLSIKDKTYAKKDLLGRYYILLNEKKENIGKNSVIYNSSSGEALLLGTFYEIKENGETKKYTGQTTVNTSANRIFKISDRKYLITGKTIKSEDNLLNAESYLLIDIDKVGNSYVYNNVINYKSFGLLNLINDSFTFKTNEEILVFNNEEIDLAKINGSTNEYKKQKEDIINPGNNSGNSENIYPEVEQEEQVFINNIHQTITENEYIAHKTTILNASSTVNSIDVNYMVYDPLTEFTRVYVNVLSGQDLVKTIVLNPNETSVNITGLMPSTTYRLDFYYDYVVEGNSYNKLFDSEVIRTKNVTGNISLEKVSNNSVIYIVKVDDGVKFTSAKAKLYIDGNLIEVSDIDLTSASSKNGFRTSFDYSGSGNMAQIVIDNVIYNGEDLGVIASYKYKL